ncbi:hypothetical protein P7C70_g4921, partial [Phenoliferia sp. Uapishka_3]
MLIVIPTIYLLLDVPSAPILNSLVPSPAEVSAIFNLSLESFLMLPPPPRIPSLPSSSDAVRSTATTNSAEVDIPGRELLTHTFEDLIWLNDKLYRLHQFDHPSAPSPVSGLTADIVVAVALIARYGLSGEEEAAEDGAGGKDGERRLGYGRWAEGQMKWGEIVGEALSGRGREGLKERRGTDQRTSVT